MERFFCKNSIKTRFNEKVDSYDSNAFVQKIMAEKLFSFIKKENFNYKKIFEIGCGTGLLTKYLITLNPDSLILNDISQKMIEKIKENIYFENAKYIVEDFLNIRENSFIDNDLICSNATFQWISDLKSLFIKSYNFLKKNGILAFSIFINGTFKELDIAFKNSYLSKGMEVKKHTLDFKNEREIKNVLLDNGFTILKFYSKQYIIEYDTPLDFLKSVHSIGATIDNSERVSFSIMKNMFEIYKKMFTNEVTNKVYSTYNVLYVIAKK